MSTSTLLSLEMDHMNSKEADQQENLVSLEQLEPSPIESPVDLNQQLPDLPYKLAPKASKTSLIGLSGSGHGAVYYCNFSIQLQSIGLH
jgi:hypothetical protein